MAEMKSFFARHKIVENPPGRISSEAEITPSSAKAGGMADSKCAATPTVLDLTKCYLCNEPFSDPKLLPCLHSFCAKCLSKHCNSQKGPVQSNAACPTCSTAFTVPGRGLGCLATNNLAKRIVELQKVTSKGGAVCGACLENEGSSPAATVYCHDCEQHLCATCSSIHKRLKTTSSHNVLRIGADKAFNMEDLVKNHVEMCPQHPNERATLYCSNCWKLICTVCFVAEHKTHACQDALLEAEEFRGRLNKGVERVSSRGEWYKSETEALRAEKQKFLTSVFEAQKDIRDKAEEAKRTIDEQQNELLKSLDLLKEEKLAEIGGSERWFGTSIGSVEHCLQFVIDVLSKGSDGDVVGLYGDMYRRLEWLLKDKPIDVTQDRVTFEATTGGARKKDMNFGGMQQQMEYYSRQQESIAYGNARSYSKAVTKGRASTQSSRCLLRNPLGTVVVTSTDLNTVDCGVGCRVTLTGSGLSLRFRVDLRSQAKLYLHRSCSSLEITWRRHLVCRCTRCQTAKQRQTPRHRLK